MERVEKHSANRILSPTDIHFTKTCTNLEDRKVEGELNFCDCDPFCFRVYW